MTQTNKTTYFVKGMHCKSCELLLESSVGDLPEVSGVKASTAAGKIEIEHEGTAPSVEKLTSMFKVSGYEFSAEPFTTAKKVWSYLAGLAFVLAFIGINRLGWTGSFNITKESPVFLFLIFGLIAGLSTCAALVGGIVLSLSDQFAKMQTGEKTLLGEILPHIQFNFGRLVSFTAVGFILGAAGSQLQLSPVFTAILVVVISLVMFWLGLQMLGVKFAQKIHIGLPKRFTQNITKKDKTSGRLVAFGIGALTILLPCGFTLTAEGAAMLSGSALRGALIMMMFVLGTMPVLLAIGITSAKLHEKPARAKIFSTIAGVVVLFFAMYNISNQLNVLGVGYTPSNLSAQTANIAQDKDLPPIVNGKQIVKMNASAQGYSPNYIKVRAGIPVRWEITDTGTSGCTNAIISFKLFKDQIPLTPGETSVKEFMPKTPGKYKFSCWMGMISGVIEVVK
jgi:sulfite exporter TauE/SafE/copper chaperone CopZ